MANDSRVGGRSRRNDKQRKLAEGVMFQFISALLELLAGSMEVKREGVDGRLAGSEGP